MSKKPIACIGDKVSGIDIHLVVPLSGGPPAPASIPFEGEITDGCSGIRIGGRAVALEGSTVKLKPRLPPPGTSFVNPPNDTGYIHIPEDRHVIFNGKKAVLIGDLVKTTDDMGTAPHGTVVSANTSNVLIVNQSESSIEPPNERILEILHRDDDELLPSSQSISSSNFGFFWSSKPSVKLCYKGCGGDPFRAYDAIENKLRKQRFHFSFEIEGLSQSTKTVLGIRRKDTKEIIFKEEHTNGVFVREGKAEWYWDGFNNDQVLDIAALTRQEPFEAFAQVDGIAKESFDVVKFKRTSWVGLSVNSQWCDIRVDEKNRCVWVIVRCYFIPGLPGLGIDDTEFDRMRGLTIEGIRKHWSRAITIDGVKYDVQVRVIPENSRIITAGNTSVSAVTYRFSKWIFSDRGVNLGTIDGTSEIIMHPIGENNYRYPDDTIKRIAAHEFGHFVLRDGQGGGIITSYCHKGSSGLTQDPNNNFKTTPKSGEIDLMIYYSDNVWKDPSRVFASEQDVKKLLSTPTLWPT